MCKSNADIIVLDESWSNIDIDTQPIAKKLVSEYLGARTVIFIEHPIKLEDSYELNI